MRDLPTEHLERALNAGRYYERYPEAADLPMDLVHSGEQAARIVAAVTRETYLIGVAVDIHVTSLAHLLHNYGLRSWVDPLWQPYVVDARSEVGGALCLPLHRRNVDDLAVALDVSLDRYTRQQAIDDAAIARDLLDAVFARRGLDAVGCLPAGSEAPHPHLRMATR